MSILSIVAISILALTSVGAICYLAGVQQGKVEQANLMRAEK